MLTSFRSFPCVAFFSYYEKPRLNILVLSLLSSLLPLLQVNFRMTNNYSSLKALFGFTPLRALTMFSHASAQLPFFFSFSYFSDHQSMAFENVPQTPKRNNLSLIFPSLTVHLC